MIITFCGHRDVENKKEVEIWIYNVTEELILKGARTFYLGGYGDFDNLCKRVLNKHKEKYTDIEILLIVPYLNHKMKTDDYDGTIYPEIEKTPPKFAIVKRNKWMVDKSDFVISYVKNTFGGAYNTLKYAKQRKKQVFNYCDNPSRKIM